MWKFNKIYLIMWQKQIFKNATGIDTSFIKKVDLTSLKSEADKLDTDKLGQVLTGLISLKSKVYKLIRVPVDLN